MSEFQLGHLLLLIISGGAIYFLAHGRLLDDPPELRCVSCGHIGTPRIEMPGSDKVELLLFALLVVPGLFYMKWRRGHQSPHCRSCDSNELVPL